MLSKDSGYMFWIDSKDSLNYKETSPDSPKDDPEFRAFLYVQIDSFAEINCYAKIYNVYTRPEYRRLGYMTRLFSYMESLLKDVPNLKTIELDSSEMGLSFYPTLGYIRRSHYGFIKILQ